MLSKTERVIMDEVFKTVMAGKKLIDEWKRGRNFEARLSHWRFRCLRDAVRAYGLSEDAHVRIDKALKAKVSSSI